MCLNSTRQELNEGVFHLLSAGASRNDPGHSELSPEGFSTQRRMRRCSQWFFSLRPATSRCIYSFFPTGGICLWAVAWLLLLSIPSPELQDKPWLPHTARAKGQSFSRAPPLNILPSSQVPSTSEFCAITMSCSRLVQIGFTLQLRKHPLSLDEHHGSVDSLSLSSSSTCDQFSSCVGLEYPGENGQHQERKHKGVEWVM